MGLLPHDGCGSVKLICSRFGHEPQHPGVSSGTLVDPFMIKLNIVTPTRSVLSRAVGVRTQSGPPASRSTHI